MGKQIIYITSNMTQRQRHILVQYAGKHNLNVGLRRSY